LNRPDDLRARFADEKLRPDIESILQQWGWSGDLNDLYKAAAKAEISDMAIPVGSTMPFMSSRENGKPICLRNVLWAGDAPAPAYAFPFASKGQMYRCVTPKACSNFFLEDLGPEPRSGLDLSCRAPEEVFIGRPARVCLVLRNTGNVPEPKAFVRMPVPAGAKVTLASEGYSLADGYLSWELSNIAAGRGHELCATVVRPDPGSIIFAPVAGSAAVPQVQSSCETTVAGLPAILIDAVDLEDPMEVGSQVTYEIKVTNQGSSAGTHVKLVCKLPESQEYVSGSGPTAVTAVNRTITTEPLAVLDPKGVATWRVVVKALQAEDARFIVDLSSDQFEKPIHEEESTHQY
jgi:uncharacterized repeat protein (TIGR01451 family)